jgi:putative NADPH-quinone reductase
MRIYILLGHPNDTSFNGALADAYEAAAIAAGHEVRRQNLGALHFDAVAAPHAPGGGDAGQADNPDLRASQDNLAWCERFVLIYPMWWGHVPALLKGWMEHVLTPGFAFRYHKSDPWWDRLLKGRTAHLIRTSTAPALYARLWYRDCDLVCLKRAVLGYCGVRAVKVRRIGSVGALDATARAKAIDAVARMA